MGNQPTLDPKLTAVLARLCKRRGTLTKTQAAKLPYLVDVVAQHVLGRRITAASHQNWRWGVVAAEVWHSVKPGTGIQPFFSIVEMPYSEGSVQISLLKEPAKVLEPEEAEIVDFVADEFGALDYGKLGKLTKAMNLEVTDWGSNTPAKIDEDAYIRLMGRWDTIFSRLELCNTEDESNWQELTGASVEELRKSLGV
ncbi:MAG TPA: type II toxin-antitoxin system antitoxin SocA domain-containing protein [Thermoanaerobaculia bacterium]|nr:type II toxin-antitoxin system antitoxin SocA domain-containing protein [Thermoanaerobaculia bacterium]